MPAPLSLDEVRHVARLARLRLDAQRTEDSRTQLTAVLGYVARLEELDVTGVEPMAHPANLVNRLDDDMPGPPLPRDTLLDVAPAVETPFLAVPKVLARDAGG